MVSLKSFSGALLGITLGISGCTAVRHPSVRRGERLYHFAVRSPSSIKELRSGRICAALDRGGVKCLGDSMIRAITMAKASRHQRAVIWDDGYCVPLRASFRETELRRVRCEWFSPYIATDRRVMFLSIPGPTTFATFLGGICVCTDSRSTSRSMTHFPVVDKAVCIVTQRVVPRSRISNLGNEELVLDDPLGVTNFTISERGQKISVCDAINFNRETAAEILRPK